MQREKARTLGLQRKRDDFEARTAVQVRKQREEEERLALEARVAMESANLNADRDDRAARDRKSREEKTARSAKLVAKQTSLLGTLREREEAKYRISESDYATRTEAGRKAKEDERKEMERTRNREYNESVRMRDQKMANVVDVPDFTKGDRDEEQAAEARMRMINAKRLADYQKRQAEERRQRERNEEIARKSESRDGDTMYFLKDNEW
jgi:hypothetical protein